MFNLSNREQADCNKIALKGKILLADVVTFILRSSSSVSASPGHTHRLEPLSDANGRHCGGGASERIRLLELCGMEALHRHDVSFVS